MLSQNELTLAGLVIGIIVLTGIFAWVVINKNSGIGVSLPKTFASELHEGLQTELEINQALVDDLDDLPVPSENSEKFFLLQNAARSYQRELEWLSEKETVSFEVLSGTENNFVAQEALQKEIAYYVLFQYLLPINLKTIQDISEESFSIEDTIQSAEQEISILEAGYLLSSSETEEFAIESGLSKEQVQQSLQEITGLFQDFKKKEFEESVTQFEKAVIGQQIITWNYTIQATNLREE